MRWEHTKPQWANPLMLMPSAAPDAMLVEVSVLPMPSTTTQRTQQSERVAGGSQLSASCRVISQSVLSRRLSLPSIRAVKRLRDLAAIDGGGTIANLASASDDAR